MQRWIELIGFFVGSVLVFAQPRLEFYSVAPFYPDGSKICDAIVVGDEVILVGGEGVILRSRDGFATWERQRIVPGEYRTIYSITALTATTWVVVGEKGLCYRTIDGGRQWRKIPLPVDVTLYRVRNRDAHVLVAVGEGGVVLRSGNQGMGWQQRESGTERTLRSVAWSGNVAVAVGDDGVVVRSTNGGYNWQVVRQQDMLQRSLYDVAAGSDERWFAVGEQMVLAKSTDGGETWGARVLIPPRSDADKLRGVWFATDSVGWIVGETSSALWQPVWETTDGGEGWKKVKFRIDTVQARPWGSWTEYPIRWWGIRLVGNRRVVYGERSQHSIVGVEPEGGGDVWYRRVWNRIVALSLVAGAKFEDCGSFKVLIGYPPKPQLVRYDGQQWDTISVLPVADVWRDTLYPQYGYYGERPVFWVWNGNDVFVGSWYQYGWWSEDGGKTWKIVQFDFAQMDCAFPYGKRGIAVAGKKSVPGSYEMKGVCWVSADGGKTWRKLLELPEAVYVRGGMFFDSLRGVLAIDVRRDTAIQIWITADGGAHWQKRSVTPALEHYSGQSVRNFYVEVFKVYDEQRMDMLVEGMVYQGDSFQYLDVVLVTTTDGGQTWQQVWWFSQIDEGLMQTPRVSLAAKDYHHKVVGIHAGAESGRLIYTRDGSEWKVLVLPKPGQGRHVLDDNGECVIVSRDGNIIETYNVVPHQLVVVHFGVTGVEEGEPKERSAEGIGVYPVPGWDRVFVRYGEFAEEVIGVELYSAEGKLIRRWNEAIKQIAVGDLAAGTYYVVVQLRSGKEHLVVFQVVR